MSRVFKVVNLFSNFWIFIFFLISEPLQTPNIAKPQRWKSPQLHTPNVAQGICDIENFSHFELRLLCSEIDDFEV